MIYFPLSLNVPGEMSLSVKTINRDVDTGIDTTSWFLPLEATFYFTQENEGEIIVDNDDPGFSIHETRKFNIASLFGQVETRAKCYRNVPRDHWGWMVTDGCLGFPVRGAYFKEGGKGNQKVQWETDLPEGTYEVFCHIPFNEQSSHKGTGVLCFDREYHYTVFDGQEEHEVVLTMDREDWHWMSLGVFNFQGKGSVTLSDRDRENASFLENEQPQVIAADAVKWVRVR